MITPRCCPDYLVRYSRKLCLKSPIDVTPVSYTLGLPAASFQKVTMEGDTGHCGLPLATLKLSTSSD